MDYQFEHRRNRQANNAHEFKITTGQPKIEYIEYKSSTSSTEIGQNDKISSEMIVLSDTQDDEFDF